VGYVRPTIDKIVLSCQSEYSNLMGLIPDGQNKKVYYWILKMIKKMNIINSDEFSILFSIRFFYVTVIFPISNKKSMEGVSCVYRN
jgi:hypothetical protein